MLAKRSAVYVLVMADIPTPHPLPTPTPTHTSSSSAFLCRLFRGLRHLLALLFVVGPIQSLAFLPAEDQLLARSALVECAVGINRVAVPAPWRRVAYHEARYG